MGPSRAGDRQSTGSPEPEQEREGVPSGWEFGQRQYGVTMPGFGPAELDCDDLGVPRTTEATWISLTRVVKLLRRDMLLSKELYIWG